MYDKILVATDGSDPAKRAVEQAISLAAELDAHLRVLCVVETGYSPAGPDYPTEAFHDMVDAIREEARAVTGAVVEKAKAAGVEAEASVRQGKRAQDAILETARAHGVDLIVLGTHGRSGIQRLLMGSVAEAVLRQAEVPVLAVRPLER